MVTVAVLLPAAKVDGAGRGGEGRRARLGVIGAEGGAAADAEVDGRGGARHAAAAKGVDEVGSRRLRSRPWGRR